MTVVAMFSKREWIEDWRDSFHLFTGPYIITAAVCESSTVANMMKLEIR